MSNTHSPPPYSNDEPQYGINKVILKNLKKLIDSIQDIEEYGINDIHSRYIRQLVKPLNKKYLYKEFVEEYDYIMEKLSAKYSVNNNDAIRSINEQLE